MNLAMEVGAVQQAAIVTKTFGMVGVVLVWWLRPAAFWQSTWEKVQGVWAASKGIEDLV